MKAKLIASVIKTLHPREQPYDVRDTVLPNFVLRVRPTGAMAYFLVYRTPDGRKTRYRIGDVRSLTPAQARDVAEQLSARTVQGEDVQATRQQQRAAADTAKRQTLGGFLEEQYLPWLEGERSPKRAVATRQRLQSNFAAFMDTAMSDIIPWTIEKWRADQRKAAKATTTINRDVTTLHSVLSKAVQWHVIDRHPLHGLKPLKTDQHGSVRYLSEEEELRLRDALARRDACMKAARARGNAWRRDRGYPVMPDMDHQPYGDHLTPLTVLALNTGLRRGELFNLCWSDVHVDKRLLTVRGVTAKTGQTRHVPLNTEALSVLTAWRGQTTKEGYVFPGRDGTGRLDNVRKAWTALLREAKIEGFRFHDTRHHFASRLVMAGTPLYTVQQLLGHHSPLMTAKYAHLSPDHQAAAVERLCHTPAVHVG